MCDFEMSTELQASYNEGVEKYNARKYSTAAPLLRRVLDATTTWTDASKISANAMTLLTNTISAHIHAGKHRTGMEVIHGKYAGILEAYGINSLAMAQYYAAFGALHGKAGNHELCACALENHVAAAYKVVCGPESMEYLLAIMDAANAWGRHGDRLSRHSLQTTTLLVLKRIVPEDDPALLRLYVDIADEHGVRKEYPDQLRVLKDVAMVTERKYGAGQLEYSHALYNLAIAFGNNRDFRSQNNALQASISILVTHRGDNNIEILPRILLLADCNRELALGSEGSTHREFQRTHLRTAARIIQRQAHPEKFVADFERIERDLREIEMILNPPKLYAIPAGPFYAESSSGHARHITTADYGLGNRTYHHGRQWLM